MTIVADESVAAAILERLRQDGLTVQAVREFAPGTIDKVVLETADKSQVILLTEDKALAKSCIASVPRTTV